MSAEGTTALYERVSSDEEFRAQLEAAESPEEKRGIVAEAGYDVSRDDVPTLRKIASMSDLSDEELEKVAGGGMWTDLGVIAGMGLVAGPAGALVATVAAVVAN